MKAKHIKTNVSNHGYFKQSKRSIVTHSPSKIKLKMATGDCNCGCGGSKKLKGS